MLTRAQKSGEICSGMEYSAESALGTRTYGAVAVRFPGVCRAVARLCGCEHVPVGGTQNEGPKFWAGDKEVRPGGVVCERCCTGW